MFLHLPRRPQELGPGGGESRLLRQRLGSRGLAASAARENAGHTRRVNHRITEILSGKRWLLRCHHGLPNV